MGEDGLAAFVNAPADTLLGKLERGLGTGYLEALRARRSTAQSLLTQCIIVDPRWDHQCEDRAGYYGELACALELPVEPLEAALAAPIETGRYWGHRLVIDTLTIMLRRGRNDAGAALRRYVGYGAEIGDLLCHLHQYRPDMLAGLDEVVVARLGAPGSGHDLCLSLPPLTDWAAQHPRLAELVHETSAEHAAVLEPSAGAADLRGQPIEALLSAAERGQARAAREALEAQVVATDAPALVASLDASRPQATAVALHGLARIAEPAHLDALVALATELPDDDATDVWPIWSECVAAIESPATLDLARSWWRHDQWWLAQTANEILERMATPDDLPLVREALATPLDQQGVCGVGVVYTGARIARRLHGIGLLPELEAAYHQLPFAHARGYVVEAMANNAPADFASRYASECLWDCEWAARMAAIVSAPLNAATRSRLHAIAADPLQDGDSRLAARTRLRRWRVRPCRRAALRRGL